MKAGNKNRLKKLEEKETPKQFKVVYWEEDKGYWMTDNSHDYRDCFGGDGSIPITEEDFHLLEQNPSVQVILVRFVDVDMESKNE